MIYNQIKPHPKLEGFIDSFWSVEGSQEALKKKRILPDGCMDLIFNVGQDCKTQNGTVTMKAGKPYLVGTMTKFSQTLINSTHKLIGVRFKPAAFSAFYNYCPLDEITDKTIEFDHSLSPDMKKIEMHTASYLNTYFLKALTQPKHTLSPVIKDIQTASGQINIEVLAKNNCTTVRQLERNFKKHIGISPKEFVNIVRFRVAFSKIKHNKQDKSLLDIAFDCGYYDHAHLSNDIKRYTGLTPSCF